MKANARNGTIRPRETSFRQHPSELIPFLVPYSMLAKPSYQTPKSDLQTNKL